MGDAFRDDHDAALARIDALEGELAREQSNDAVREHRVAALEQQLAQARTRLREAEAELAKHRPAAQPDPVDDSNPAVFPTDPPEPPAYRGSGKPAAIAVAILLILIVVAGLLEIATTKQPEPQQPQTVPGE